MKLDDLKEEFISGVISLVISLVVTYGVSWVYPTFELDWALTAVGFASFFSGFFSHYYAEK
ncbi:MAG: hypothetical protein BRC27_02855 [Nanohaloarchaea archaeon SW_10_44_10]|nr:MAG: hypothetical protein BRC27_02855 [Nanohaloarchaea archaeon SW_10_44_10]